MAYYRTCPYCGAHLDPGEQCDCRSGWETTGFLLLVALCLAADGLMDALGIIPVLCVAAVTLSASWACHLMAEKKPPVQPVKATYKRRTVPTTSEGRYLKRTTPAQKKQGGK